MTNPIAGPWKATKSSPSDGFECFYIVDTNDHIVTHVDGPQSPEREAIAALIASAPDLIKKVEALEDTLKQIDRCIKFGENVERSLKSVKVIIHEALTQSQP